MSNEKEKVEIMCTVEGHIKCYGSIGSRAAIKLMGPMLVNLTLPIYLKYRGGFCDIFNKHIEEANRKWDLTRKPTMLVGYPEDTNPEYIQCIKDEVKEEWEEHQRFIELMDPAMKLRFDIDETGICAWYNDFADTKFYITTEICV